MTRPVSTRIRQGPSRRYGHEIDIPEKMPQVRTPLTAIKARCLYCAGTWDAVAECDACQCDLFLFRRKMRDDIKRALTEIGVAAKDVCITVSIPPQTGSHETVGMAFLPAIRRHCLWCCGNSPTEVELCTESVCPLFRYRSGSTGRQASAAQSESAIKAVAARQVQEDSDADD